MTPATTELMTTREVAALVRVSPATVRAWARQEKIRVKKLPGGYRYWRSDVLRFVEGDES